MSINAINGNSFSFGMMPTDPIKPETRQKLKELGIDEKSVKTETQAQNKIHQKEEEIRIQVQQRMQEQASTQVQTAQAGSQNVQQVAGVDKADKVDGLDKTQQIQQPNGIEQQYALNNKQQGNEQVKAFAGSQNAQAPKEAQQAQPFDNEKDLLAMYKKLQLGLI